MQYTVVILPECQELFCNFDKTLTRSIMFKTTTRSKFFFKGFVQGHPTNSSCYVVSTAQYFIIHKNARTNARSHTYKNYIFMAFRISLPNFAQYITGTVTVDLYFD